MSTRRHRTALHSKCISFFPDKTPQRVCVPCCRPIVTVVCCATFGHCGLIGAKCNGSRIACCFTRVCRVQNTKSSACLSLLKKKCYTGKKMNFKNLINLILFSITWHVPSVHVESGVIEPVDPTLHKRSHRLGVEVNVPKWKESWLKKIVSNPSLFKISLTQRLTD